MRPDRQILESAILVTRFQRGETDAFDAIVQLWERSLFYYLRRLTASESDAWDLVQETWLKLYRSLSSLRDPRTLPAFLYTTARNAAVTRKRIRDPLAGADNNGQLPDNATGDCTFVAFDDAEQVHHALDQLPLPQREALTLYFLEELSIEEIAQVLGVPAGTVKSRLHYAKSAIRNLLSQGDRHD